MKRKQLINRNGALYKNRGRIVSTVILTLICAAILLPIIWGVVTSFRDGYDLQSHPESFFPTHGGALTLENYKKIINSGKYPVFNWILNSFFVATLTAFLYLLFASLIAYMFVFMDVKRANVLFGCLLATMTVPGIMNLTPMYTEVISMGLKGTLWGLILPGLSGVYGMFLMKQFFSGIPKSLIESAKIDGASHFGIYFRLVLPLGKNALMLAGLFSFLGGWNDLQWAQLIVGGADPKLWTLSVGLSKVIEGTQTYDGVGLQLACAIISMIPVLILYLVVQDKLINGYMSAGVKG